MTQVEEGRMNRLILLLIALPLLSDPARSEDKALKDDLAKLQGNWKATVGPERNRVTIRVTFDGTACTFTQIGATGKQVTSKGEIRLDESARPHKTIDW